MKIRIYLIFKIENRIFSLIESFSYELSETPMNYKTTSYVDDNIFEIGLSSTMSSLGQVSSVNLIKVNFYFQNLNINNKRKNFFFKKKDDD